MPLDPEETPFEEEYDTDDERTSKKFGGFELAEIAAESELNQRNHKHKIDVLPEDPFSKA